MLDLLREKNGVDGRGLDVSDEAVRKCRAKGIPAEVFDFGSNSLPFEDNEFDYVLMMDVLEHLYTPSQVLSEAARVTKNAVIIGVPNFNSLVARLQVLRGKVPENNTPGKGHVFWVNKDILSGMIADAGLTVADISMNTYWQNRKLLAAPTRMLMRWMPKLFALSFIVKAKKKP